MSNAGAFEDTQLVEGEILEDYVIDKEGLNLYEIYKITLNLCDIIEKFHKEDFFITLRELNPRNIIIMEDSKVKIVEKNSYSHMLQNKNDDVRNYKLWKLSKQNDLYNVGKIIYFMATGKIPRTVLDIFIGDNYPENIDKNLKNIIYKCFEGNDKNTYFSVEDLSREISMEILRGIKHREIIDLSNLNVEVAVTRQRKKAKVRYNKTMDFRKRFGYLKDLMGSTGAKNILTFVRSHIL
ncbi:serine/threonine protein kinase [Clostridium pascui]|uniref:hypothetical protein n=1 Tax=Clostridium pascui TaxID=46609 RepID=UPI0019565E0B|nr:hypothetical protein [Clostridium pascui]MBM7871600.1 serine/threonine protein kinase [Clostridium pascui]